jgi:hypothetical protein
MNLMKFVPNAVSLKVGRSILLTQKHSPTILFGIGIVGVVATAVLASRATLKLEKTLDVTEQNIDTAKSLRDAGHEKYSNKDYQKDVTLQYARGLGAITRLYGPTVIVGIVSIGCLTGSHRILTTRNTGLTAAYAVLQKGFDEYRARVREDIGVDKDLEYRYGIETYEITELNEKGKEVVSTATRVGPNGESIYARFFSKESSGLWSPEPYYNMTCLKINQNYANNQLHSRGHLFLNEVYEMLGLKICPEGQVVGWVMGGDGDEYVDFGCFAEGENTSLRTFMSGPNDMILLDFNCDGEIYKKIGRNASS